MCPSEHDPSSAIVRKTKKKKIQKKKDKKNFFFCWLLLQKKITKKCQTCQRLSKKEGTNIHNWLKIEFLEFLIVAISACQNCQNSRVSAANSSQISDGAAAIILMSAEKAKMYNLQPKAKIVATAVVGSDPRMMLGKNLRRRYLLFQVEFSFLRHFLFTMFIEKNKKKINQRWCHSCHWKGSCKSQIERSSNWPFWDQWSGISKTSKTGFKNIFRNSDFQQIDFAFFFFLFFFLNIFHIVT